METRENPEAVVSMNAGAPGSALSPGCGPDSGAPGGSRGARAEEGSSRGSVPGQHAGPRLLGQLRGRGLGAAINCQGTL